MSSAKDSHRIEVAGSERRFQTRAGESILDGALRAGFNLPHSCKGGNCGSCMARVVRGEFAYSQGAAPAPLGITAAQSAEGFALLCQARARSDMLIDIQTITSANEVTIKRLPCRVARAERLAHDVMGVTLRLPAAESFDFLPGQYVDVMLSNGRRRSFSIASPPPMAALPDSAPPPGPPLLELHVRRVVGGEFSERAFGDAFVNSLLTIEGPLGQFVYRESAAPMLMIGGGTGLAPLHSILRYVFAHRFPRDMTLYWGVRSERDLYAHAALVAAAREHESFRYVPVLSEPSPGWQGARGLVHEAALSPPLRDYDIYASGPPAMIDAVRTACAVRGVAADRIRFDSFDYAPDVKGPASGP